MNRGGGTIKQLRQLLHEADDRQEQRDDDGADNEREEQNQDGFDERAQAGDSTVTVPVSSVWETSV